MFCQDLQSLVLRVFASYSTDSGRKIAVLPRNTKRVLEAHVIPKTLSLLWSHVSYWLFGEALSSFSKVFCFFFFF